MSIFIIRPGLYETENERNGETETFEDKETGRQGETVTCRTGRMNPMDWKRALNASRKTHLTTLDIFDETFG